MAMPKQLKRLVEQSTRTEAMLKAIMAKLEIDESEVDYVAARNDWNARVGSDLTADTGDETTMPLTPGITVPADASLGGGGTGQRAGYERIVGEHGEIIAAPADPSKATPVANATPLSDEVVQEALAESQTASSEEADEDTDDDDATSKTKTTTNKGPVAPTATATRPTVPATKK